MQSNYPSGGGGVGGASELTADGSAVAAGTPPSGHSVRMRGLPWSAKDSDINDFFLPLVVVKVVMSFDHLGRPSGDAEVYFSTHQDATAAMQKNKQHIGELESGSYLY